MNREEVSLQGKGSSPPNVDGMFSKHMHTHTLTHTTPRGSLGAKKALLPSIPIPSRVLADGDWLPACCEGENSGLWCGFTTWDHPSIHPGKTKLRLKGRMDASRGSEASQRRRGSSSQPRDFRPDLALFNASGMTWMARRRQIDRLVG
ncbi:hypothetical protein NW757_000852 [Fusarium falciforme]|nr:hypothetical protein NW757_000852 [Fusarium falciforme]